jgi:hypothetical protein
MVDPSLSINEMMLSTTGWVSSSGVPAIKMFPLVIDWHESIRRRPGVAVYPD